MPIKPFDYIKEIYRDKIERDKKTLEFMHGQTDGFITWIIGFAFTGLLLITGNVNSLKSVMPFLYKIVASFLFTTVVCGVILRFVSFIVLSWEKELEIYYVSAFSESTIMPLEVDEEIDPVGFEEIINLLALDFDESIEFPPGIDEEYKHRELPKLREHYKALCNYAKESMKVGIGFIANIEQKGHRIPKKVNFEAFEKAYKNPQFGYNASLWAKIRLILFLLCLLTFVIAVSIGFFALLQY